MEKAFSIILVILFLVITAHSQRPNSGGRTENSVITLERPAPHKDGFTVCEKYSISLSSLKSERGIYAQTYSVQLKKGEHFQVSAYAEKFKLALTVSFKADSIVAFKKIRDLSKTSDESYALFDSAITKDGTLLITISNANMITGDLTGKEIFALNVYIANEDVRKLSSNNFCDKLLFLSTHVRYDLFMLKGTYIEGEETKSGYAQTFNSVVKLEKEFDEIYINPQTGAEYNSLLFSTPEIKLAKQKLDEYIRSVRQCISKWRFKNEEKENFDEQLGKAFGVVSYSASFINNDNLHYGLTIGLGQSPGNKNYIVLLQFYPN